MHAKAIIITIWMGVNKHQDRFKNKINIQFIADLIPVSVYALLYTDLVLWSAKKEAAF